MPATITAAMTVLARPAWFANLNMDSKVAHPLNANTPIGSVAPSYAPFKTTAMTAASYAGPDQRYSDVMEALLAANGARARGRRVWVIVTAAGDYRIEITSSRIGNQA